MEVIGKCSTTLGERWWNDKIMTTVPTGTSIAASQIPAQARMCRNIMWTCHVM